MMLLSAFFAQLCKKILRQDGNVSCGANDAIREEVVVRATLCAEQLITRRLVVNQISGKVVGNCMW